MNSLEILKDRLHSQYAGWLHEVILDRDEVTAIVKSSHWYALARILRDHSEFTFDFLVDVCGIDYLHYGLADWETESTTRTGFGRGVMPLSQREDHAYPYRFAAVYHLLSLSRNERLRVIVPVQNDAEPKVHSAYDIWPAANWFEREAYDLFGIYFEGHPDLRRLLTDYGFQGHPFRKDFPLIGKVEARYDATEQRVVYDAVSIEPRVLEPKVIRHDHRYQQEGGSS